MASKGRLHFLALAVAALLLMAATPANGLMRSRPEPRKPELEVPPSELDSLLAVPPMGAMKSPVEVGTLTHDLTAIANDTAFVDPHRSATAASGTAGTPPISYHGGPVMLTPKVVLIYYYNGLVSKKNLDAWISSSTWVAGKLGTSSRWAPNRKYYEEKNGAKKYVGELTLTAAYSVKVATGGVFLTQPQMKATLEANFKSGTLAYDADTIYTFTTVPGSLMYIDKGYCSLSPGGYCAYHNHYYSKVAKTDIKFAIVPAPDTCNEYCGVNEYSGIYKSPTGSSIVDGFFSSLYHELSEAATDPLQNAWFDNNGYENGDKCLHVYGKWSYGKHPSGYKYKYNAVIGGYPFTLQEAYNRVSQSCVQ